MSLCTLASSPSWMLTMDTGQSSSTRTPARLQTFNSPIWMIPFPVTSLWPHLLPRHVPEEDGPDPQRVPRMYQNFT